MQKSSKLLLGGALAAFVCVSAGVVLFLDVIFRTPDFSDLKQSVEVNITLKNGSKSKKRVGPKAAGWVPFSEISPYVVSAVVSSEDTSFFSHEGVDYHELKEAIKKDLEEKRFARGASTITQQVVKNVYLSQEKSLWRKFKEFFWARELDRQLTKREILAFYLNLVEWGPGIYGIREAAGHYFGTSAAGITAKKAAFLAMMLPSPVKYHAYFDRQKLTRWASGRIRQVLRVMWRMKFIDDPTYQSALTEHLWHPGDEEMVSEDAPLTSEDTDLPETPVSVPPPLPPKKETEGVPPASDLEAPVQDGATLAPTELPLAEPDQSQDVD